MLYQTIVLIKIAYYWENEKNMQMFAEKKKKKDITVLLKERNLL